LAVARKILPNGKELYAQRLQYDPRGYIFVSEMVTGIYVIQYDGDKHPDYVFPPLFNA